MQLNDTNQQKLETLFGGRLITITREDGSTEEIRVRQLPLADFEKAFALLDDELGLVALICGKDKAWLNGTPPDYKDGVSPESYENLHAAAREVNLRGFFSFSDRRQVREQATQDRMVKAMSTLTPDALKTAMELGAATSQISSRTPPSRRG